MYARTDITKGKDINRQNKPSFSVSSESTAMRSLTCKSRFESSLNRASFRARFLLAVSDITGNCIVEDFTNPPFDKFDFPVILKFSSLDIIQKRESRLHGRTQFTWHVPVAALKLHCSKTNATDMVLYARTQFHGVAHQDTVI